MAMSTLSHRRKEAKYGKAYGKNSLDLSFAADNYSQASWETSPETLCDDTSSHCAKVPAKRPIDSHFHPFSTATVKANHDIRDVHSPPAGPGSKAGNALLYDLESSEGQTEQQVNVTHASMRKGRIITPADGDGGLQGGIDFQAVLETEGRTNETYDVKLSYDRQARSKPNENPGSNRPQFSSASQATTNRDAGDRQVKRARIGISSREAFEAASAPTTTSAKSPGRAVSATPPPHLKKRNSSGQDGCGQPKESRDEAPRTPIKLTLSRTAATTPRQRELWSLLSVDGTCYGSPSYAEPPVLSTPESEFIKTRKQTFYPIRPGDRNENSHPIPRPRSRRKRLIDTLRSPSLEPIPAEETISCDSEDVDSGSSSTGHDQSQFDDSEAGSDNDIPPIKPLTIGTSPNRSTLIHHQAPSGAPQATACLQLDGLRVTYAQQRSYLKDHGLEEAAMSELQSVSGFPVPKRSCRLGLGVPLLRKDPVNGYGYDEGQDSQCGSMRSIYELREAGGNARLVGELETSLDDLDEAQTLSASARRSALVSIVSKLQEASTCRLLVDMGLEARFLAHVDETNDLITDSLFAAAILRFVAHSTSTVLTSQLNSGRIKSFLIQLLVSKQDLIRSARSREVNLSRVAQGDYIALCTSLLEPSIWCAGKPHFLSCQALSLQCLEYIVRRTREAGLMADFLSAMQIQRLVDTTIPSPQTLPYQDNTAIILIELAMSTLDTMGSAHEFQDVWSDSVLERITGLLPGLRANSEDERGKLEAVTLRFYLNITNRSSSLCEAFAHPHIIDAISTIVLSHFGSSRNGSSKQQLLLDRAILSLGCLINLAESSSIMRNMSLQQRNRDPSLVDSLLDIFLTKRWEVAEVFSEQESACNVAFGYVSVLICCLCASKAVRSHVESRLPHQVLQPLLEVVEEFLQYHRLVDGESPENGCEGDTRAGFVSRLQSLVDDLKG
ncbi:MAG: hypothetical protein Q9163_001962 [Psora crenata]